MAEITMKALEKMLKEFTKNTGDRPYAFFCNKETFEKIEKEMLGGLQSPKSMPPSFSCNLEGEGWMSVIFSGIPVFKSEGCPDDMIYAFNKETSLKIGAGKFSWEEK